MGDASGTGTAPPAVPPPPPPPPSPPSGGAWISPGSPPPPPGSAATGGAAATGSRGPVRWGRVIGGVAILLLLAVPCLVATVLVAVVGTHLDRQSAVAEGRAPGTLTFDAGTDRYVIALSTKPDGWLPSGTRSERRVRSSDAVDARCTVTHPDGTTSSIRGDRQASATSVQRVYETVGVFTGKGGETTVECRFDPAEDLLGSVTESPVIVHPESSTRRVALWGSLAGALVFGALGTLQILRGTVWRRPKR